MARFRRYTQRRQPVADINITNLVDVMMVLLIIFIIVTPFLKEGLRIKLPKVRVTERLGQQALLVEVDQHGAIALNGKTITLDTLSSTIKEEKSKHPKWPVHLKVDGKNIVQDYFDVLSAIREAGIDEVGTVTEKKQES
jgi:biopolymer transport protein ExbD